MKQFKNKSSLVIVLLVMIMVVISGCGGASKSTNTPTETEKATATAATETNAGAATPSGSGEPIKIGVLLPLTGPAALAGESAKKGLELHVDIVNASGGINGRKIAIEMIDHEDKAEIAARGAEKLIGDGVIAIAGPYLTPTAFAVDPIAAKNKIPLVTMSGGFQPIGSKNPWSWTIVAGAGPAIEKTINFMLDKGLKRLATITPTDALGNSGDKALKSYFDGAYKGKLDWVGNEKFNLQDVDITAQLSKLKAQKPDLVFVGASGEAIVTIRKQMNQIGMQDIPLATYHSNTTREMIKLIGTTPGRMLFPATAANVPTELPEGDLKVKATAFADAFNAKYGQPPMTVEGFGYDSIGVIIDAIRAVGPDSQKIGEWLNQGQTIVGVNQVFKYTPENHVGGTYADLFMVEAEAGSWKIVK